MAKNETIPNDEVMAEEKPVPVAAKASAETPAANQETDTSGFCCYIGPGIAGVIQHGAIFRGTRAEALEAAKDAIERQPLVKSLIVSGDHLPVARLMVKTPGNALYLNARRISGKA